MNLQPNTTPLVATSALFMAASVAILVGQILESVYHVAGLTAVAVTLALLSLATFTVHVWITDQIDYYRNELIR